MKKTLDCIRNWRQDVFRNSWRQDVSRTSRLASIYYGAQSILFVPATGLMFRIRFASLLLSTKSRVGSLISIILWRRVVQKFGCYISPKASIGAGVFLPHPIGIVIGEDAVIDDNVTIYQGVTIGQRGSGAGGYPFIERDVVIYCGASILGPVRVGEGAIVGAHAVVISNVPAGAVVVGTPARVVSNKGSLVDPA